MDPKIKEILSKVRVSALDAGKAAGKFAGDVVEQAKLNIQIFDLNTDIEVNYKEIGKLVYAVHKGDEICSEAIDTLVETVDSKNEQIKQIRAKLSEFKTTANICPVCGKTVCVDDTFCSGCGYKFNESNSEACACDQTSCDCDKTCDETQCDCEETTCEENSCDCKHEDEK